MRPKSGNSRALLGLYVFASLLVVCVAAWLLFLAPKDTGPELFPSLASSAVMEAPGGHAYQYIAAANLSWDQARSEAAKRTFKGKQGYLATMDSKDEFDFVMQKLFPREDTDVTYLGGRQTAPGEWRWVTGPDAAA